MVGRRKRGLTRAVRTTKVRRTFGADRDSMPKTTRAPARAWQRMLSGRRLDLLDPSPLDVEIEDIAHGLARVARWNGQTVGPHAFSVAQHALTVDAVCQKIAPGLGPAERLAVLLHDAPEYVIGDMISPFKAVIGEDYKAVEARLLAAIHQRFGLPAVLPEKLARLIKSADRVAAFHEATQLAGFRTAEAVREFGRPAVGAADLPLRPWPTATAEHRFLARFNALSRQMAARGGPAIGRN
jgi:5'-deoxynucleotidase YfbR-like HD superfamily hydrolase